MNSYKNSDRYLSICVILIILVWIIISFNNRLVDDDLIMVETVKNLGVWGSMVHFYDGWNTRWAAYLLQCSFYQFWTETSKPVFFNLFTLIFMSICSYSLIHSYLKKSVANQIYNSQIIKLSILFIGGLIVSTYHIGDTWFWVSGSTMYGWNLGCGMLILAIYFSEFKWWQIPILLIAGLFIGGAAEPFAVCFLLAGGIFIFSQIKQKNKFPFAILISSIAIAISFGIACAGKGHAVRSELLPSLGIPELIARTVFFSLKLIVWHSPFRILGTILIFIPFYTFGTEFPLTKEIIVKSFLKKKLLPLLLIWLIWLLLHCILITKLMGNYGPPRAWSSISLLTAIFIAYLMFEAGRINLYHQIKSIKSMRTS